MKKTLYIGVFLLFSITTIAQELPDNADPNKCYVKSKSADVWENKNITVNVAPSYTLYVTHPAEFKKINKKVVIDEGRERLIIIPETYKTIEVPIEIKEASEEFIKIPGKERIIEEEIVIEEASQRIEIIPAEYKFVDVPIVIKKAYEKIEIIPAKYETKNITVVTEEPKTKLKIIPAKYGKKVITYQKRDYGHSLKVIPAVFKIVKDSVLTRPSYGRWQMSAPSPNCTSKDLNDCRYWFYNKIPAQYTSYNKTFLVKNTDIIENPNCIKSNKNKCGTASYIRKVIKNNARVETFFTNPKTITLKKMVMVRPPRIKKIKVPQVVKIFKKKIMVTPPSTRIIDVPEKTITIQKMVTTPDTVKKVHLLAGSVLVKKKIVDKPYSTKLVKTDPVFGTVRKTIVTKDAWKDKIEVKPKYKTFISKILKEKGGKITWKTIDCNLVKFNLLPIRFSLNSYVLTLSSKKIINERLLPILHSGVALEIAAHTDAKGTSKKNQILSSKRAKAVVKYLISKGISPNQLLAVGYGETKLLNHCTDNVKCTEKEHAINRRVEFRVINQK